MSETYEAMIVGFVTVIEPPRPTVIFAITREGDRILTEQEVFSKAGYYTEEWVHAGRHPFNYCIVEIGLDKYGFRNVVKVLGNPPTSKSVRVIAVWNDVLVGRKRLVFLGMDGNSYINDGGHTGIFERAGYDVSLWGEYGFTEDGLNMTCLSENNAIVAVLKKG